MEQLRKDFEEFKVSVFIVVLTLFLMIMVSQGMTMYMSGKVNETAICQHVLPEARTLTCEEDHGPS